MTTHNVSTAAHLTEAIADAVSGDVISMAPGNYGAVSIVGRAFTDYVTLISADPLTPAVVTSIRIDNSAFVMVAWLHVDNPSNGPRGGKLVYVFESNHVKIRDCEVNAKVDDNIFEGNNGISLKNSSDVEVSGNDIHDVHNGILIFGGSGFDIRENLIDHISTDCFKAGGVRNILLENNTGGGHIFPSSTAHSDFIQFQGSAHDVTIRGNVYLAQTTERAQGIFMNVPPYSNVLIEQNIIYSGKVNAIKVKDGTGITCRQNTVLVTPGIGHKAAAIILPSGATNSRNISANVKGGISGSNVTAQWDDVNDIHHYTTLYQNAMAGLGITLADLRPVQGSLAETKGAAERIAELLDDTVPTPDPDPDPTPDPDPDPVPDPTPDPALAELQARVMVLEAEVAEINAKLTAQAAALIGDENGV